MYARRSLAASEWAIINFDPVYEILWVNVVQNEDITFVGVIYHPPQSIYSTANLLDLMEEAVIRMHRDFPDCHVILAGDLNALPDSEIIVITEVTGSAVDERKQLCYLDRVYVSDLECETVKR
jgi:hypothetical protein